MSKNIYQRINAVMKEVAYVQKDASVSTGGSSYRAVTHDMVLAVLRKEMVAHGIVVRVEQLRSSILQFADKDKGIKQHLYSGDYAVHFHNMDEPADCLTVTVNGHAADNQDKAPGKAMSYAVKYAMLKTFGLETGENEEGRFSEPFTAEQLAVYHDLLENDKAYEFYLFTAALPPETTTGLVNSFPDGKKTQGKKKAGQLEQEGNAKFLETVEEVQTRIANHDISVTEITDEMSAIEKRLLISRLSKYEVDQLSKIKQAETAA